MSEAGGGVTSHWIQWVQQIEALTAAADTGVGVSGYFQGERAARLSEADKKGTELGKRTVREK